MGHADTLLADMRWILFPRPTDKASACQGEAPGLPPHDELLGVLRRPPLLAPLLRSARALLGYADDGAERAPPPRQRPSAELLCAQAKALCRTTDVRFFQWCTAGRVRRGQIPSMPECRDDG